MYLYKLTEVFVNFERFAVSCCDGIERGTRAVQAFRYLLKKSGITTDSIAILILPLEQVGNACVSLFKVIAKLLCQVTVKVGDHGFK